MAVEDAVEDSGGQILISSHHPELINQWATSGGVQFIRDGIGPVRVEDFHFEPASGLAPAELVARGWEHAYTFAGGRPGRGQAPTAIRSPLSLSPRIHPSRYPI